jgi:hypothetical protein
VPAATDQLSTGRTNRLAKNRNTFEKRRREVEKRQRADEKRKKRVQRKIDGPAPAPREEPPESSENE